MIRLLILFLLLSSSLWSQQEFEICGGGKSFTYSTEIDIPGSIQWFLNGDPIGGGNSINIEFNHPGEYQLVSIGYNELGCPGLPQVLDIAVTQCDPLIYWVPNSFTPDDDEFNQDWGPILTSGISVDNFKLIVYNRWGSVIWESSDTTKKWDGTFAGTPVATGTYTWTMLIDFLDNDGKQIITGHVNVIR